MILLPPSSTHTYPLLPYTPLFRSRRGDRCRDAEARDRYGLAVEPRRIEIEQHVPRGVGEHLGREILLAHPALAKHPSHFFCSMSLQSPSLGFEASRAGSEAMRCSEGNGQFVRAGIPRIARACS